MKNYEENRVDGFVLFDLKTIDLQVACKLEKNGIKTIYDSSNCKYTEEQIKQAIKEEIEKPLNNFIDVIQQKKKRGIICQFLISSVQIVKKFLWIS